MLLERLRKLGIGSFQLDDRKLVPRLHCPRDHDEPSGHIVLRSVQRVLDLIDRLGARKLVRDALELGQGISERPTRRLGARGKL